MISLYKKQKVGIQLDSDLLFCCVCAVPYANPNSFLITST